MKSTLFALIRALLLLALTVHFPLPTEAFKVTAKTNNQLSPQSRSSIWTLRNEQSKQKSLPLWIKGTVTTVKSATTNAGILIAAALLGYDFLVQQSGQIGTMAATAGSFIQKMVQFPIVALTLFFLFSIDSPQESKLWTWFFEAYPVYLFRFVVRGEVGFFQYAVEGAVGIAAVIKALILAFGRKNGRQSRVRKG